MDRRSVSCLLAVLTVGAAPAAFAQGGPDDYGYTWTSAVGPLDWVDVQADGTALSVGADGWTTVSLPWNFPYYGHVFDEIQVNEDGGIVVQSSGGGSYANSCLPTTGSSHPDLAVFWDDLRQSSSFIGWFDDPASGRFVVSWQNLQHYSHSGGTVSFQAQLYADGRIDYLYQDATFGSSADDRGQSATVGVQDRTGPPGEDRFLEVGCNGIVLDDNLTLSFEPPANMCLDQDFDGDPDSACGGGDCDDTDPTRSSLAVEICDGQDNDCDGALIPDDADNDGDGVIACEDCDDGDSSAYPLAPELCDGIDNNCDSTLLGIAGQTYLWDATNMTTTGASARVRGAVFRADRFVTVEDFSIRMGAPTTSFLFFSVYEAETVDGSYARLQTVTLQSAVAGDAWRSSGPVNQDLQPGRYYAFVVGWTGSGSYDYRDSSSVTATPWGEHVAGAASAEDPVWSTGTPPDQWSSAQSSGAWYPIQVTIAEQLSESTDADSDGAVECEDCDESDASVSPLVDEVGAVVCGDGVDNDCDGVVDAADPGCAAGDDDDAGDDDAGDDDAGDDDAGDDDAGDDDAGDDDAGDDDAGDDDAGDDDVGDDDAGDDDVGDDDVGDDDVGDDDAGDDDVGDDDAGDDDVGDDDAGDDDVGDDDAGDDDAGDDDVGDDDAGDDDVGDDDAGDDDAGDDDVGDDDAGDDDAGDDDAGDDDAGDDDRGDDDSAPRRCDQAGSGGGLGWWALLPLGLLRRRS